jgi:hypothetical protein
MSAAEYYQNHPLQGQSGSAPPLDTPAPATPQAYTYNAPPPQQPYYPQHPQPVSNNSSPLMLATSRPIESVNKNKYTDNWSLRHVACSHMVALPRKTMVTIRLNHKCSISNILLILRRRTAMAASKVVWQHFAVVSCANRDANAAPNAVSA